MQTRRRQNVLGEGNQDEDWPNQSYAMGIEECIIGKTTERLFQRRYAEVVTASPEMNESVQQPVAQSRH